MTKKHSLMDIYMSPMYLNALCKLKNTGPAVNLTKLTTGPFHIILFNLSLHFRSV